MKLDTALNAIDRAMDDILETEIRNIFANIEPVSDQTKQLETGFDRINAFEANAIATAKRKFKP